VILGGAKPLPNDGGVFRESVKSISLSSFPN
jgi:hypothetical protein